MADIVKEYPEEVRRLNLIAAEIFAKHQAAIFAEIAEVAKVELPNWELRLPDPKKGLSCYSAASGSMYIGIEAGREVISSHFVGKLFDAVYPVRGDDK
jgi:hypothetical protein